MNMKNLVFIGLVLTACGCASKPPPPPPEMIIRVEPSASGVADYVWEEPMTDVIDVPPGLDPDGVYYRPGHQEVIEIRQGRWKMYKKKENVKLPPTESNFVDCDAECKDDCPQNCR